MVTPVLSLASFKPPAFPGAASYKGRTLRDQVTSGLKSDTTAPYLKRPGRGGRRQVLQVQEPTLWPQ